MDEKDNNLKLNFLLTGSNLIPQSCIQLKSYLNIHSSSIADIFQYKLPKNITSKILSCPYCFTPWNLSKNAFTLLPSTRKKFKTNEKIGKSDTDINSSNSFCYRNKLVVKCKLCHQKTLQSLVKHSYHFEKMSKKKLEIISKKKKKKSKFNLHNDNPQIYTNHNNQKQNLGSNKKVNIASDAEKEIITLEPSVTKKSKKKGKPQLVINPKAISSKPSNKHKLRRTLISEIKKKENTKSKSLLKEFLSVISK